VFTAALIGSLVPLVPFILFGVTVGIILAVVLSAGVLFAVGVYKARVMVGRPGRSGLQMAAIGMACAFIGYAVGWLLQVPQ
jgi:predicted membrane protein (TIGR00267 family)